LGWHPVAALPDIYTTGQYPTYIERKILIVRSMPRLCLALYPGIRLTTEGRRLRVFENNVLRRIYGPKRDEVTGVEKTT
jgi:hypothetical protein